MRISIDDDVMEIMNAHALRDYPHECCGALFGAEDEGGRHVLAVMPIENVSDEDRRRRFSVSPRDYIRAEREAERLALALLGFYHSHPDHPAQPSATDRQFAQIGFSYPILSVTRDHVVALTSWRIVDQEAWYEEEKVGGRMKAEEKF
jgi:proteasome lid subunit RPN8/RPN11